MTPDSQALCNPRESRVILEPFFLLRDSSLCLDPLFHQEEDQAGLQYGVTQCAVGHLVHAAFVLLEELIRIRRVGKRPYQVLLFKKMIPENLLDR
jgi:hypothetical protein